MDVLIREISKEGLVKIMKCENCGSSDMELDTYDYAPDEIVCDDCGIKKKSRRFNNHETIRINK
ncbi:uncharacterized protein KNN_01413 [Bacillus thuringiensis serovar tolworthi]|uniref:Uncharacterized protein n=1 Tax=Bacillus thuringiensis subsp. tolworthi TaxID=1442 RepID=A0A9W3ZSX2_BACTO|nr:MULTISPECIES: hypothetical protein [Bacillus cereus group]MEB8715953.1 hypothetical protein [Bacillus cereus]MED2074821.1 hypothetical protein [Bacillus thuringiensis]BAR82260.1 uncharacterized protein KNN_01413 [Bacillus thuringiensis serovar tolworthi]KIP24792.1 hypothetical protein BG10_910 [Bacillus thuringiensis serovar morrisoni]MEB9430832.1 hypothetical protein [Bacillus cereus]